MYLYDSSVWDRIHKLSPSARNELEITDLNNMYVKDNQLAAFGVDGWWGDAGESIDVYIDTCVKVADIRRNK